MHVGGQALHALDDSTAFHGLHFAELLLGALGCAPAQVAFTALGAHQKPRTRQAKPFRGCLMGF